MIARNLNQLGEILYEQRYLEMSQQMLRNMMNTLAQSTQVNFYSNWIHLLFDQIYQPFEIVVMGPEALKLSHQLMLDYQANNLFLGALSESDLPLLAYKYVPDTTMIYVCKNKVCKLPVSNVQDAKKLLQ